MADEKYEKWCKQVDRLGIKEGMFDPEGFRCTHGLRRPDFLDADSFWRIAFDSGMSPQIALGESLVEQDCEL